MDVVTQLKVINFAIFALCLGYALFKLGPRFFNARSADIQKAIKDATGLKLEADYRYSEIDKKIASLGEEVKKLRAENEAEMERERERVRRETETQIGHIQDNTAAEIDAWRIEGVRQVRRYGVQMAVALAERRLQARLAAGEMDAAIHDFVNLVRQGKN
jgi:F-type H+-transporting ATPase subunit b